mmetsp:Transcript_26337/g.84340  ORF Transcript_26337/g.84340 Transcript_26337/m.84340 type:complete len:1118 (-) Transcript_26337:90-3443(-)|eukprot:CAMPEP_0182913650 /NCGR_PEP_ID=MMETSP0034_2-20130328/38148_1 /TAXON_ID=156128 /ORGANISM="Nephroselmis pyriformis, Strain CCMP717" /LENGTH=1117 /DNA_ID=CAMNT_0025050377 /DNA_START=100 /DNA_END=3453 /DNA_ORIENTATION=+
MNHRAALVALLVVLAGTASAYHLGDIDEYHCWDTAGKEKPCPDGVALIWDPSETVLEVNKDYNMTAGQHVTQAFIEANNLTDTSPLVPHANFHICRDTIGFCTPFITSACGAPGTFTSTSAAKMGNGTIVQKVTLPAAGRWVALWHIKIGKESIATARFLTAIDEPKCPIGFEEVEPSTDVPDGCRPCPAGFRGTEQRTCEPCKKGYYSPEASQRDADGTVIYAAQCLECDILGPSFYGDLEAQAQCKQCPANSQRSIGTPGVALSECLCRSGFWQTDGLVNGAACEPCQEPGGVCKGGLETGQNQDPFNAAGWWGQKATRGQQTGVFIECYNGAEWCHENFVCDSKHQGRLCMACADDHFSLGGYCLKCRDSDAENWVMTLVLIFIVAFLWVFLNTRAVEKYFSLDITLAFLQLYQLVGFFSIRWPTALSTFHAITNFALFDINFVQPECIGTFSKSAEFAFQLLLNPFVAVVCVGLYYFNAFHASTLFPWYRQALGWKRAVWKLPVTKKQLSNSGDVLIGFFMAFLIETYASLCVKAFESFICEELPDGSGDLLLAWPDITCWEGKHWGHVAGSVLGIAIFVIGVPVWLHHILKTGAKKSILANKEFFTRYGFMYARYHLDYYYWEVTLFMRKVVMAAITVFLRDDGLTQCALAIVFLVLVLAAQAFAQPYRSKSYFYLDCLGLLTVILYALAGVLFQAGFEYDDVAQVVVFVPMGAAIFWTYMQFRSEYVDKKSSLKAIVTLAERLPTALIEFPDAVDENYANMIRNIRAAFDDYDTDHTGELNKEQLFGLMRKFTSVNDDELEGLFKRCDVDGSGQIDRQEFETLVFVELLHLVRLKSARESYVAGRMNVHNSFTKWSAFSEGQNEADATVPSEVNEVEAATPNAMTADAFRRASVGYEEVATHAEENNVADDIIGAQAAADSKRADFKYRTATNKLMSKVNNMMAKRDERNIYGELATTIQSRRLWDWILTQKDMSSLVLFYKMDKILTPHLTDHSMHSAYSNNPLALFHHDLLLQFPFVLDYLVEADDSDVDAFRSLSEKLVRFQYRVKNKRSAGRIANIVHPLDHSALCIWIHSFSRPEERRDLQKLLEDICEHVLDEDDQKRCAKLCFV